MESQWMDATKAETTYMVLSELESTAHDSAMRCGSSSKPFLS